MIGEHHSSCVGEHCACSRVSYRASCRFPYCSVRHTSTTLYLRITNHSITYTLLRTGERMCFGIISPVGISHEATPACREPPTRSYLRCPGAICCPARRALWAGLQPHPVLRRADRRRVEPTAPMMRRLSLPAGCGGCSVRGKPRRCLQDSVNRGTRVRHHPRPRTTARSRFSSRSGSEWTVGAAPARSRCPPGPPWPGLARGRAAERRGQKSLFSGRLQGRDVGL